MTDTQADLTERDEQRLADLRRRRADVYSPKRERNPYYGDDDIDLLLRFAQSEREVAAAAPMQHLRAVLYMLADLHPDDQCDAFQQAMLFYNDASETKIEPSGIDQDRLLSGANLQTRIEVAAAEARRAAIEECAKIANRVRRRAAENAQQINGRMGLGIDQLRRLDASLAGQRHAAHEIEDKLSALASPAPQEETR